MIGNCGHAWDGALHRACPRCAIAEVERRLKRAADRFREIERLTCPVGSDYGNGDACRVAREALRELLAGPDGSMPETVEVQRGH